MDLFFRVLFIAKGAKTTEAIVHLQKANPTGGIWPFMPLAITKFTDQSKVAQDADKIPFVWLFIFLNSKKIVLNELVNFSMLQ